MRPRPVSPLLLLFLLFVSAGPSLWSQEVPAPDFSVFPSEYYVGDIVEIRVALSPELSGTLRIPPLPSAEWVEFISLELQEGAGSLQLVMTVALFSTGIRALPAIDLGGVVVEGIKMNPRSLLNETGAPFSPPAGVVLLPGSRTLLALVLGVAGVLVLFLLLFRKRITEFFRHAWERRRKRRPYDTVTRLIRELKEQVDIKPPKEFYTALIAEVKAYLSFRSDTDLSAMTSRELYRALPPLFPAVTGLKALLPLFEYSDTVKFGAVKSGRDRMVADLAQLALVVEEIEADYRRREEAQEGGN